MDCGRRGSSKKLVTLVKSVKNTQVVTYVLIKKNGWGESKMVTVSFAAS